MNNFNKDLDKVKENLEKVAKFLEIVVEEYNEEWDNKKKMAYIDVLTDRINEKVKERGTNKNLEDLLEEKEYSEIIGKGFSPIEIFESSEELYLKRKIEEVFIGEPNGISDELDFALIAKEKGLEENILYKNQLKLLRNAWSNKEMISQELLEEFKREIKENIQEVNKHAIYLKDITDIRNGSVKEEFHFENQYIASILFLKNYYEGGTRLLKIRNKELDSYFKGHDLGSFIRHLNVLLLEVAKMDSNFLDDKDVRKYAVILEVIFDTGFFDNEIENKETDIENIVIFLTYLRIQTDRKAIWGNKKVYHKISDMFCEYNGMIESRFLGREYENFLCNLNRREVFDFDNIPKGFNALTKDTREFISHLKNWQFDLVMCLFYKEGYENLIKLKEYLNMKYYY